MSTSPERALFPETGNNAGAGLALCLTVFVLLLNSAAASVTLPLAASAIAAVLLLAGGLHRVPRVTLWLAILVGGSVLAGSLLAAEYSGVFLLLARVTCGVLWIIWLGTRLDWQSLRKLFLTLGTPTAIVDSLDQSVAHAFITRDEWQRRHAAARLRLGRSRLPVSSLASVVGGGALATFERMERVDERARLRAAAPRDESPMPVCELIDAAVIRDGREIIAIPGLAFKNGEWVTLCGPSGAGKSTLLSLIAGTTAPDRGELRRLGKHIGATSPLRQRLDGRVGFLGQNPEHHFIAATVGDDIAWGLQRRGICDVELRTRLERTAEQLGIRHLLGRACHSLSLGEQQRAALAGVVVLEPQLLLLDEPTAGLDPVTANRLAEYVSGILRRTGATCLWATHDLHALPRDAARTLLLKDGEIVFDGSTDEAMTPRQLMRADLWVTNEQRAISDTLSAPDDNVA